MKYEFIETDLGMDTFLKMLNEFGEEGYRMVQGTYRENITERYYTCIMELVE
jgi:hypothetical protein